MAFDDILRQIGEFGVYQKRLYALICIPAISVISYMMILIVVMETPKHRIVDGELVCYRDSAFFILDTMAFDDLLRQIGEFGNYQKRLYALICIPSISVMSYMMILIVTMEMPKHRCKIPTYDNDTYRVQNEYHRFLINISIPPSTSKLENYDSCHMYLPEYSNDTQDTNNVTLTECSEWVYDKSVFKETFSSKTNLVCKNALKISHAQMIFYFGVFVGDIVFGIIADKFGRKTALYMGLVILITAGFAVCWAPEYVSFVVLHFIIGGCCHGAVLACCVLGVELVGPSKRFWAGMVIHLVSSLGFIYLAGVAYFRRHWQYIELAVVVPCVFYLAYWWLIPESPRWLISQGRQNEAEHIIRKAARINKTILQDDFKSLMTSTEEEKEGRLWHLFTSKILFIRTMIIFYNWVAVCLTYYGVTMNAGNLGGSFFLNLFLFALSEVPAYALATYLLEKIGRKKTHCLSMLVGGIACVLTTFTVVFGGKELFPVTITLAVIGRLGSSAAFAVIYVYSEELYPTVVRNAGMGASSCAARIGGMIAPYVAKSGHLIGGPFGQALHLIVFGISSISAGLLTLFLPETLHQSLPESIEDGKQFGRKRKRSNSVIYSDRNKMYILAPTDDEGENKNSDSQLQVSEMT